LYYNNSLGKHSKGVYLTRKKVIIIDNDILKVQFQFIHLFRNDPFIVPESEYFIQKLPPSGLYITQKLLLIRIIPD
jgi:hypothetical protein